MRQQTTFASLRYVSLCNRFRSRLLFKFQLARRPGVTIDTEVALVNVFLFFNNHLCTVILTGLLL